jgi:hypothetical protein
VIKMIACSGDSQPDAVMAASMAPRSTTAGAQLNSGDGSVTQPGRIDGDGE